MTSSHLVAIPVAAEDNYAALNCVEFVMQIGRVFSEAEMKAGIEKRQTG